MRDASAADRADRPDRPRAGHAGRRCDVTREATSDILGRLKAQGLYDEGAVAISGVDAAPSRNAWHTEEAAPGAPDDAVVWDAVVDQGYAEARGSWAFYAFLTLTTQARWTDPRRTPPPPATADRS